MRFLIKQVNAEPYRKSFCQAVAIVDSDLRHTVIHDDNVLGLSDNGTGEGKH